MTDAAAAAASAANAVPVVVLGAGCIGLACAVQLLKYQRPPRQRFAVTILAEAVTPNTTSDGAGALWRPTGELHAEQQTEHIRWGSATFDHLLHLYATHGTDATGISPTSGYELHSSEAPDPFWKDTVFGFRRVPAAELAALGWHPPAVTHGFFFTSLIVDMPKYLAFLHAEFDRLGGRLVLARVQSVSPPSCTSPPLSLSSSPSPPSSTSTAVDAEELLARAHVIVNCTGLGAAELVGDTTVRPVRGYVVRVRAPHVHHFVVHPDSCSYVFPRQHEVVCGGTYDHDCRDTALNAHVRVSILERCGRLVRGLERAPVVNEWVGLRPSRPLMRLEWDESDDDDGGVDDGKGAAAGDDEGQQRRESHRLLHCYGHGGSGVTLHWGVGRDVVQQIAEVVFGQSEQQE